MNMKIFISYPHSDKPWVSQLQKALQDESHHLVWMDAYLELGEDWWNRILDEIESCDCFIFVQSKASLRSEFCRAEVNYAQAINQRIMVLKRDESSYPPLENIQTLDVSNEENMARILLRIEKGLGELKAKNFSRKAAKRPKVPKPQNPKWRDLPISDFMLPQSKLVCIKKDISLADAHEILDHAQYRFRHLIITENGEAGSPILGIVSLRDMLKQLFGANPQHSSAVCVEDIMTPFSTISHPEPMFITIHQRDNLETAIQKFLVRLTRAPASGRFYFMSAIPVIGEDNVAVSIVSYKDILSLANEGKIPLANSVVGTYYRPNAEIVLMTKEKSPQDARWQLGKIGQRDVPIVNKDGELLGLVPDHILLQNLATHRSLGEIMVPVASLKLQSMTSTMSKMLSEYLPKNISATYYSFVVVDDKTKPKPELLGMIGYREIFRAILDND